MIGAPGRAGQPFDAVHARLRDHETTHSRSLPVGITDHHDQLAHILEPLVHARLAVGLLRLHERDPAAGAARLVCPGPSGSEAIVLELPDPLRLPGKAPEHR